jgi:uncharacterized membrane protein
VVSRARGWFLGATALYTAVWIWSYGRLPERVPIHFGGSGDPDRWSSRAGALWTTALLGLGMVLLFAGLAWLLRRVPPQSIDVPSADFWRRPENVGRLRDLVAADVWLLAASTLVLLTAVQFLVVRAAAMAEPRLDAWAVVVVALYLVGVVLGVLLRLRRYAGP